MIQIKNGQFQWPGSRKQTLNIPYFSVKPKEKILITGQSGSGKSTLLSLNNRDTDSRHGEHRDLRKRDYRIAPEGTRPFPGESYGIYFSAVQPYSLSLGGR